HDLARPCLTKVDGVLDADRVGATVRRNRIGEGDRRGGHQNANGKDRRNSKRPVSHRLVDPRNDGVRWASNSRGSSGSRTATSMADSGGSLPPCAARQYRCRESPRAGLGERPALDARSEEREDYFMWRTALPPPSFGNGMSVE